MQKKAIISGATGLIGHELLHLLIKTDYYDQVVVFSNEFSESSPGRFVI
jgi:NAD dependent epimerase/dehydratase family enzyme